MVSVCKRRGLVLSLCVLVLWAGCAFASVRVRSGPGEIGLSWPGSNEPVESQVTVSGPVERAVTVKGSGVLIGDLPSGVYEVRLLRGKGIELFVVDVPMEAKTSTRRSDSGPSALVEMGLDTSLYPNIALQFRPVDSNGGPIGEVFSPQDFKLYEEGRIIPDFSMSVPSSKDVTRVADLVVVFDDTGSMGPFIDHLKERIVEFIGSISGSGIDLRYRLITYKDDANDGWFWTTSPDLFKEQVSSLRATGGADWYEDGFEAMKIATEYDFRPGAQRVFMLFTDAPCWEGRDEFDKPTPTWDEMVKALKDAGVVLYAIARDDKGSPDIGHSYSHGGWSGTTFNQYNGSGSLTDLTGGKWFDIYGDFSPIIDEIGSAVGGSYLLSYRTPNLPETLSGDDVVDVRLTFRDSIELLTSYDVNIPPVVTVYGPTKVSADAGVPISFDVVFGDLDGDGISSLRFTYRFEGDESSKYIDYSEGLDSGRLEVVLSGDQVPANAPLLYSARVIDGEGARAVFPKDGSSAYVSRESRPFVIVSADASLDSSWNMTVALVLGDLPSDGEPPFLVYKSTGGDFAGVAGSPVIATKDGDVYKVVLSAEDMAGFGAVQVGVQVKGLLRKTRVFYYAVDPGAVIRGKADTVILTNLAKMSSTAGLEKAISDLVVAAWKLDASGRPLAEDGSGLNMLPVVVDLQDRTILSGAQAPFQLKWDGGAYGTAEEVLAGLKALFLRSGLVLKDSMTLVIVGANEAIPYGTSDNAFSWLGTESDWYKNSLKSSKAPGLESLYAGNLYPSDVIYRNSFLRAGRLVETADDATALINRYISDGAYLVDRKNLLYLGGYDRNNEADGFLIGKWLKSYSGLSPNGWTADNGSVYDPTDGFAGTKIVSALNAIGGGIAVMTGHGHYYLIQNGKGSDELFFAGAQSGFGSGSQISSLENVVLFTNACHSGLNFVSSSSGSVSDTDFPEIFAQDGRALAVYVANTPYGIYTPAGVGYSDRLTQNAVRQLVDGTYDTVVYDGVFKGTALPYEPSINEDIMGRPQFYGIPSYRLGPAPVASTASKGASLAVSRMSSVAETVQGGRFFESTTTRGTSSMGLKLEFKMISGDYSIGADGKVQVYGVGQTDSFGRPALLFSTSVPKGSSISGDFTVTVGKTKQDTYGGSVSSRFANSDKEETKDLNTSSFDDMVLASADIDGDRLVVSLWPVQYNTSESSLRITEEASISLNVTFPKGSVSLAAVDDADMDGLPGWWERAYGLDDNDPSGINGPDGDPDVDGLSNMEEFLRGTDPNSKYSGSSDTTDVSWGADRPTIALTSESVSEPTSSDVVIALTDLPDKAVTVQLDYWPKGFEAQLRTTDPVPVKGATTSSSKGASGLSANVRLSGLKAGTEYVFKAIAFDALGVPSTPSGEVSFKTAAADAPAPVDPENPKPSSGGGCDIGATPSMALLLLAGLALIKR
ncbi:VWA domain-containing protein [Dethiosulfovibrio salsuginis]|uniref:von Willebrand factor type A domain-containing protein n=1 Tax=Dethiosulfovibrio salsuginis TaxID=561720 RepID=A0A1X7IPH7_9BACT|nr:VWA domain-containing protein [Dethiosulfovibrio salsuginis]SMG16672.1 von Willebrand factor type A domain-containing protein [Dethiosulfovibrio salsuginis]